nr:tRNA-dihydrouridine synthase family protein [Candidatus Sigynarchaeota archaeon]
MERATSFLAPMVGFTDNPGFLYACKRYGCDVLVIPMLFIEGISANKEYVEKKIQLLFDNEASFDFRPVVVQVIGQSVHVIKSVVDALSPYDIDGINLNLGCPSTRIRQQGLGASMLNRVTERDAIIDEFIKHSNKPFSVKMRLMGNDAPEIEDTISFCKSLEERDIAWIAVHGRTLRQGYKGPARWNAIKMIHDAIHVPVVGNGDLRSVQEGIERVEHGFCHSFMIGRGALRDPRCFNRDDDARELEKSLEDVRGLFSGMVSFLEGCTPERARPFLTVHNMKTVAIELTRGITGSRSIRQKIARATNYKEIDESLSEEGEHAL